MIAKVKHEIEIQLEATDVEAFSTTKDFLVRVLNIFCDEFNCDQCPFGCGPKKDCSLDKVYNILNNCSSKAKFYTN